MLSSQRVSHWGMLCYAILYYPMLSQGGNRWDTQRGVMPPHPHSSIINPRPLSRHLQHGGYNSIHHWHMSRFLHKLAGNSGIPTLHFGAIAWDLSYITYHTPLSLLLTDTFARRHLPLELNLNPFVLHTLQILQRHDDLSNVMPMQIIPNIVRWVGWFGTFITVLASWVNMTSLNHQVILRFFYL